MNIEILENKINKVINNIKNGIDIEDNEYLLESLNEICQEMIDDRYGDYNTLNIKEEIDDLEKKIKQIDNLGQFVSKAKLEMRKKYDVELKLKKEQLNKEDPKTFAELEKLNKLINKIKDFKSKAIEVNDIIIENEPSTEFNQDNSTNKLDEWEQMIKEVIQFALENNAISTTMIQRKFKLGYARASRIMDELEERKIIGPMQDTKPRQVLITQEDFDKMYKDSNNSLDNDFENLINQTIKLCKDKPNGTKLEINNLTDQFNIDIKDLYTIFDELVKRGILKKVEGKQFTFEVIDGKKELTKNNEMNSQEPIYFMDDVRNYVKQNRMINSTMISSRFGINKFEAIRILKNLENENIVGPKGEDNFRQVLIYEDKPMDFVFLSKAEKTLDLEIEILCYLLSPNVIEHKEKILSIRDEINTLDDDGEIDEFLDNINNSSKSIPNIIKQKKETLNHNMMKLEKKLNDYLKTNKSIYDYSVETILEIFIENQKKEDDLIFDEIDALLKSSPLYNENDKILIDKNNLKNEVNEYFSSTQIEQPFDNVMKPINIDEFTNDDVLKVKEERKKFEQMQNIQSQIENTENVVSPIAKKKKKMVSKERKENFIKKGLRIIGEFFFGDEELRESIRREEEEANMKKMQSQIIIPTYFMENLYLNDSNVEEPRKTR